VMDIVYIGRHHYTNYFAKLRQEDHRAIDEGLRSVNLEAYRKRFFHELSDGEKQRVLIAKALAQDTPLIMLDEPTAHLDLPNRVEIMNILNRLAKETSKAILISTHELDLALQTADTIWLMNRNDNLVTGAPEELVLTGRFEQVFKSDSIRFDKHSGSFKLLHQSKSEVALSGNGLHSIWAKKALEREGYKVVFPSAESAILVSYEDDRWVLKIGHSTQQCSTIKELLSLIREEK